MSDPESWENLRAGRGCPLDYPRDDFTEFVHLVRKLSVSSLYLSRGQAYRGTCILVYDVRHVVRLGELSRQEWHHLAADLHVAESAVFRALAPDHINVEQLGNAVPHLHWHIIPRYRTDGRWGGPIWTTTQEEMPSKRLAEAEYAELAARIDEAMAADDSSETAPDG